LRTTAKAESKERSRNRKNTDEQVRDKTDIRITRFRNKLESEEALGREDYLEEHVLRPRDAQSETDGETKRDRLLT
jgi:hypothetical protein